MYSGIVMVNYGQRQFHFEEYQLSQQLSKHFCPNVTKQKGKYKMHRKCKKMLYSHITQETRSLDKVSYLSEVQKWVRIFCRYSENPWSVTPQVNISDLSTALNCGNFLFGATFAKIFRSWKKLLYVVKVKKISIGSNILTFPNFWCCRQIHLGLVF